MKKPRAEHINAIKLSGNMNNNKMERFNGEIRDREKTMRELERTDTSILQGYQLFHNYIRPHEALDDKTPSEACGITVKGKNKWLTLIQNAQTMIKKNDLRIMQGKILSFLILLGNLRQTKDN